MTDTIPPELLAAAIDALGRIPDNIIAARRVVKSDGHAHAAAFVAAFPVFEQVAIALGPPYVGQHLTLAQRVVGGAAAAHEALSRAQGLFDEIDAHFGGGSDGGGERAGTLIRFPTDKRAA
jgi:hypothetical protein